MVPRRVSPFAIALVLLTQAVSVGHCHGGEPEHEPRPHLHLDLGCCATGCGGDQETPEPSDDGSLLILPSSLLQGFLGALAKISIDALLLCLWLGERASPQPEAASTHFLKNFEPYAAPPWSDGFGVVRLQI